MKTMQEKYRITYQCFVIFHKKEKLVSRCKKNFNEYNYQNYGIFNIKLEVQS